MMTFLWEIAKYS